MRDPFLALTHSTEIVPSGIQPDGTVKVHLKKLTCNK